MLFSSQSTFILCPIFFSCSAIVDVSLHDIAIVHICTEWFCPRHFLSEASNASPSKAAWTLMKIYSCIRCGAVYPRNSCTWRVWHKNTLPFKVSFEMLCFLFEITFWNGVKGVVSPTTNIMNPICSRLAMDWWERSHRWESREPSSTFRDVSWYEMWKTDQLATKPRPTDARFCLKIGSAGWSLNMCFIKCPYNA